MSDRIELQALLSAGGEVHLDGLRTYVVDQSSTLPYCLIAPTGTHIYGHGATIRLAPSQAGSVRILYAASNVTIQDLILDGNLAAQVPNEHRHGVFVFGHDVTVSRVTARSFTGDGVYLYTGADRALVDRCLLERNGRNGITISGSLQGAMITRCTIANNLVQQIDHEPVGTTVDGTLISECMIDCGAGQGYAVTLAGASAAQLSRGYRMVRCTVTGCVEVIYAEDVTITGCTIESSGKWPAVHLYRSSRNVTVERNLLTYSGTLDHQAVVMIQGSGGQGAEGARITGNQIHQLHIRGHGVRAEGATTVQIDRNQISGLGGTGIRLRATTFDRDFERACVMDNVVTGFNEGCLVGGNGSARMRELELLRNSFLAVRGVVLAAVDGVPSRLVAIDNQYAGDGISGIPSACEVLIARDAD